LYTSTCVRYEALPITEVGLVHDDQFNTGIHLWLKSKTQEKRGRNRYGRATGESSRRTSTVWLVCRDPSMLSVTLAGARLAAAAAEGPA
jgi:hypothetical protein